ncbi:hypothetical protein [Inquilinus sp. Marseille-Q2685]|uniref:hypothetical protein n=1 Tax=Inquilinus sp. Marseille-Q2685 TaxID=2866581 RepID=UPI001CE3E8BD|nr:hypothetical protein [Inquilinus sp. Marseille-Q2685]
MIEAARTMEARRRVFTCLALSLSFAVLPWRTGIGIAGALPREDGWMSAQTDMARPPDEQAVIAREFRGAVDQGSNAALIRFIARHPGHALADEARLRLQRRTAPDDKPLAHDPDATVYAAYDAARRAGTAEAYRDFARTYANHPLAAEANRQIRAPQ